MSSTEQYWNSFSQICRRTANAVLTLAIMFMPALVATQTAQAQAHTGFNLLYTFTEGGDGYGPSGVIRDAAGNLYGTTGGGSFACSFGCGTVFKLDTSGTKTVLYSFTGNGDGYYPSAVIGDAAGNLYGTTLAGGTYDGGTVFKLDPNGTETVLYNFTDQDGGGYNPAGPVTRDAAGNLYGTTSFGGTYDKGTVFKVDPSGTATVLYSFTDQGGGGYYPSAGVTRDPAGNLYGTTYNGGTLGKGTVYKLDPSGTLSLLHSFTGADGFGPTAEVILDAAGNLYGTTLYGGAYGPGTVYKLDPNGTHTVLHSFSGGADGGYVAAGVIRDGAGNLYGSTTQGGNTGGGTVFKLDPSGTETVLHSFTDSRDGSFPGSGVIRDRAGNLYGTTAAGPCCLGGGTVFRISP